MVDLPIRWTARLLDRFANAQIGPAAADVAGHRVVDIGIRRMRVARKQRRSRHDLARLAVAALNDLAVEPGLLDLGARRCRADRLDRRDLRGANAVDIGDAGTGGDAIDMHGAGAAQRHAAAELGAGHAQHVAQHPEERRVAVHIYALCVPIDFNGEGHGAHSFFADGDRRHDPPTHTCAQRTTGLCMPVRTRTQANADKLSATVNPSIRPYFSRTCLNK
jgi:hypothetical protein